MRGYDRDFATMIRPVVGHIVSHTNAADPENNSPIGRPSDITYNVVLAIDEGRVVFNDVTPIHRIWPDDLDIRALPAGTPFVGVMRGKEVFISVVETPDFGDCDPAQQSPTPPEMDAILSRLSAMSPAQRAMIRTAAQGDSHANQ